jgi:hypothetical protein
VTASFSLGQVLRGPERVNNGIIDGLMKVAVGVCTAGVLWLLSTTATVNANVATMQVQQKTLADDIGELKESAKLPRVTKEDLSLVLEPMGQRVSNSEDELRQHREWMGSMEKRVNQSENEISIIKLSIPQERGQ